MRAGRGAAEVQDVPPGWHALGPDEVLAALHSSIDGLASAEASRRLLKFGPNTLPERKRRSLPAVAFGQLRSPLIYLLVAAALISVLLGEYDDSVFIVLVLAINTGIGTLQEWRAEANTAALRSVIRVRTRALRDSVLQLLDSADLVPGDVIALTAGDRVPADLRLLGAVDLMSDESALTGESLPVEKSAEGLLAAETAVADRTNMLHAGSSVQRGRAEAVVVSTGVATELGRIATALDAPAPPPPLTRRLDRFTQVLGAVSVAVVALIVGFELLDGSPLRETFFVATALAVSIIPEGLPVAVTVALSIATRRMAHRNVIVRHLPAVEGLGACTVIATDKTGTLTVNQLTAKRIWLPGRGTFEIAGGIEKEFLAAGGPATPEALAAIHRMARAAVLCNDAVIVPELGAAGRSGDTVDLALLVLGMKAGLDPAELRRDCARLGEIPFEAHRRYAATLNAVGERGRLNVKGAAEVLLPLCAGAGREEALAAEGMAAEGYRVLAIVCKDIEEADAASVADHMHDMTLLGLVGFIDPLRDEAKQAVANCREAGVAVKMLTGDHPITALAIAREVGIATEMRDVATGAEIAESARRGDLAATIGRVSVFARVDPQQKLAIVAALQSAGEVVAVTGDGVNDAPALMRADLGVAMGRSGTDIARDAADLVLTDDNFASIVAGIEEGRAAYANIRKVIYLLVSTGFAEVVVFTLSTLTGLPMPLTAIQLLWLNLVTNGGQDVALAFEQREPGLLKRRPRSPREPIFDRLMVRQIVISGGFMGLIAFAFWNMALATDMPEVEARNLLLFLMVGFENVHVFNCRSESASAFQVPFRGNWPVVGAVIGAQIVHITAAFMPGLRDTLEVAPISLTTWLLLVPLAASVLLVMEVEKRARGAWRRSRAPTLARPPAPSAG